MMIRDARPEDASALAALWNPWITETAITFAAEPKSPQMLAQLIAARQSEGHAFLVAEEPADQPDDPTTSGPRLLGLASYRQFRAGSGYARSMEHSIILAPQARGKGTGRALMAALEAHARDAGHRLMVAAVSSENPEGRDFHLALGYQMMGQLPEAGFKFGRAMDLWFLGKLL